MKVFSFCKGNFAFFPTTALSELLVLCQQYFNVFLHAPISLILTNGNDYSKIQSRQPINTNTCLGGRCWSNANFTDYGVMRWGNKPSYICSASSYDSIRSISE